MFLRQKTPLHCALEMGHVDIVELLVKHGAKVRHEKQLNYYINQRNDNNSITDTSTAVAIITLITLICTNLI